MTTTRESSRVPIQNIERPPLLPVILAEGGPSLTPLLAARRSSRSLVGEAIGEPVLVRLLEAARWAASSMNAQPWSFIVVRREDVGSHAAVSDLLMPGNRVWAPRAPLLLVALAQVTVEGKPRATALFDLGLAVSQLVTQATAEGLAAHTMGGFDKLLSREVLGIPEGWEPVVVIAVGHEVAPDELPAEIAQRDTAPRTRKPLAQIAFEGRFGAPLHLDAAA